MKGVYKMKRTIRLLSAVLMCFTIMLTEFSFNVKAATTITSNQTGTHDGYDYELWKDSGNTSMTLNKGGTFSCQWNNINNVLFRKGKKLGETQTHQQLGNISVNYSCNYQPNGNSYLCIYGWTTNPLVEYYIVESWGSWRPPGATSKGTITVDGGTYDIYETSRINQPSIKGTATFQQYWSVRQRKKTSGTISVSQHFKAWESKGMKMGKMYEVAFTVEGYQSSGKADVTGMSITIGKEGPTQTPIPTHIPTPTPIQTKYYGDVNNDGTVDSIDFGLLKSYLLGKAVLSDMEAADINVDSRVDSIDLAKLKTILLDSITPLPIKPTEPLKPTEPPQKYDKIIALTFDDGPDTNLTPLVLEKLEKYNAPATFMVIGQKINDSTSRVIKRIINLGCEIGNHSWSYQSMNGMSETSIKKSVNDTTAAIIKYSGTTPTFFRAPNLATSNTMLNAIDLTFVGGITCNDWVQTTTARQRADAIINGARDGAIILMHDVQPLPHPTPEALDIIIPTLKKQGYGFVTLSELFRIKGVTLKSSDNKIYTYVP
jgi:peptidoglycan/xylan/chitin deacetylase (PgdA/CDA1 family)